MIHPEHPFARYAFSHDGEIRMNRGWTAAGRFFAGMALVLNPLSLLTRMRKELAHRLRYSEFHDQKCTLTIYIGKEPITLDINHGQVQISKNHASGTYQLKTQPVYMNPLVDRSIEK